ncbi:Ribosome biogenesis protein nsa1 (NOP7-associated protein 1) [Coemansia erecta]|nr:Ribosome biogenesis protein nsa1 (NOP7-associated protein 1) [Coemansia erecta]
MRFYTGDESGLIKCIDIDANVSLLEAQAQAAKRTKAAAKAKANLKAGEQAAAADTSLAGVEIRTIDGRVNRSNGIQQMCTTKWATNDRAFAVARKNGNIDVVGFEGEQLFTYTDEKFAERVSIKHNGRTINERSYVGLSASDSHFLSCTNMGEVRYQSFATSEAKLMKLPLDACRMRTHNERSSVFAVGGREHELSVWDAETLQESGAGSKPTPIFRAKNVANDFLNLRVPVWITDIQFTSEDATNPTLAVSTGHKQIRLYDARAQQRPVNDWEVSKHPIYHLQASHVRPELYFADNMGNVQQMDMRTGHVFGAFKGIAGAVKSISLSEDGAKIAVAGLDRYVRVFETGSMRRPLHRAYVKQRVSHVVWDWEHKDFSTQEIEEQEAEDIWETMDKAALKKKSNKRKAAAI